MLILSLVTQDAGYMLFIFLYLYYSVSICISIYLIKNRLKIKWGWFVLGLFTVPFVQILCLILLIVTSIEKNKKAKKGIL